MQLRSEGPGQVFAAESAACVHTFVKESCSTTASGEWTGEPTAGFTDELVEFEK
jgi:hypothetical protein